MKRSPLMIQSMTPQLFVAADPEPNNTTKVSILPDEPNTMSAAMWASFKKITARIEDANADDRI